MSRWVEHWIQRGFTALERWVVAAAPAVKGTRQFCYGAGVTLADVCLVPQMFNARRFKIDVTRFPNLVAICSHLERLPEFAAARPEVQPDAE